MNQFGSALAQEERRSSIATRPFHAQHPPKLKDEAYNALERLIVNGEIAPGEWVSETDLMNISGHSRASVRSAIQRLADEGLATIVPRRGAQICPIDYALHFRSLEFRRVVETLVATSAAKRASAEERAKFAEFADQFMEVQRTKKQSAMTDLDAICFSLMRDIADNPYAARALTSVKGLSRRFWVLHHKEHGDIEKMANGHARIAKAISEGDQEGAAAAVNALIDYVESFTLEVVGYSATKPPGR